MSLLIAMGIFSLTTSISPGPVNMVIVSSGANHGFRRTLPFVSGATIGFTLLLVFVGFWLIQIVSGHPVFLKYLEFAGAAFMMYVGCKIASAPPQIQLEQTRTPTFMEGFLLQWLNPKAWIACASGAALFSDPNKNATLMAFVLVYFLICYISLAAWAVLGDRVSVVLNNHTRIRLFNLAMGGMLILTAASLVYAQVAY
jgi:threonine/homoserine/homoserine lactone efflux protein